MDKKIRTPLADDPELRQIVEMFIDGLETELGKVAQAVAQADFDALSRLAHSLKGSGGSMGFDSFRLEALELEKAALSRQLEQVRESFAEIQRLSELLSSEPVT